MSSTDSTDTHETSHGQSVSLSPVWHVGNLSGNRIKPYISYEGMGISVSVHPQAWEDIMRRDGSATGEQLTTYRLENPTAEFYFVDPTADLSREREWCLEHRFVSERPGYQVSYVNHLDELAYFRLVDEDRSHAEADARHGTVEPRNILQLDTLGITYWEEAFDQPPLEADPVLIEGLLPVWFAREQDYDGVWWDERLDPANFSAPRGTIFQARLESFEITTETR